MRFTTHQLAQELLKLPDMPVAVGRSLDVYQASPADFATRKNGTTLVFDGDRKRLDDVPVQQVFWFSGPLL